MASRISAAAAAAGVQAVVDLVDAATDAGYIEVRTGTQPASVDTAASGTLLATIPLPSPLWASYTGGTATANTSGGEVGSANGDTDGDAGWYRAYDGAGVAVLDGSAGTSGTELVLNRVDVTTGEPVTIEAWTVTLA
jgi:hypothetical protein